MFANRVSPRAVFTLALHEGVVPTRYYDVAKVATWGVGHTRAAGGLDPERMPLEMPTGKALDTQLLKAWAVFEKDLIKYTREVLKAFGDLTQNELDGLVSWHFNTGGAFTSSAVKKWRRGDKVGALRTIASWNKVTKNGRRVVSETLTKRRREEIKIITKGVHPSGNLVVWGTNGKGKIIWRPVRQYSYDAWTQFLGGQPTLRVQPGGPAKNKTLAGAIAAAVIALASTVSFYWDKVTNLFGG